MQSWMPIFIGLVLVIATGVMFVVALFKYLRS